MSKKRNSRASALPPRPGNRPPTYHLRDLSTEVLTSGLPYQRRVDPHEVDRLVREWDERLYEPVIVSYRDGKFNVIDGQHRLNAMRKRNHGRDLMIRCKVYSGMTYAEEAELCFKLDRAQRRLSCAQATNALLESGTDQETMGANRRMQEAGLIWALGRKNPKAYEVIAAQTVINVYRDLGDELFGRMCRLLADTWEGNPVSLQVPILTGTALFLKTYEQELNDNLFIKRLSAVDPGEIIRRGRGDVSTSVAALRYARILLEKYNGVRGGKKLVYRFHS